MMKVQLLRWMFPAQEPLTLQADVQNNSLSCDDRGYVRPTFGSAEFGFLEIDYILFGQSAFFTTEKKSIVLCQK